MKLFLLVFLLIGAPPALRAEEVEASPSLSDVMAEDEDENEYPSVGGWIDLRPSWTGAAGTFHAENEVALEYRFEESRTAGYSQEFRSEWLRAGIESEHTGFDLVLGSGYFWADVSDLTDFFSWEPRVYVPTSRPQRLSGLVVAIRQYLKFELEIGPTFSLFFWEIPILSVHTRDSYVDDEGETVGTSFFSNRIELGARLALFQDRLGIKLPLVVLSEPGTIAWLYPEVMWKVAPNTGLGVAFYTDSLFEDSLSEAFRRGVGQVIFQQVL